VELEFRKRGINIVDIIAVAIILIFIALLTIPAPWPHRGQPANQTTCMSNLMNISMALKMYQLDHHAFPDTLAGYVQTDENGVVPFSKAKGGLHGDYGMRTSEVFRCPNPPLVTSETAVVEVSYGGKTRKYYAIDSYDICTPGKMSTKAKVGFEAARYRKSWADSEAAVGKYPPFPLGIKDSAKLREEDYKKQLKWRDPPDDTVITWCSNHKKMNGGRVVVIFLNGTCKLIPAIDVEGPDGRSGSRWRTKIPPLN
jgi:hypothetical protein